MDANVVRKAWRWRTQTWIVLSVGLAAVLVALVASYAFSMLRPVTEVRVGQAGIFHLWVADTDVKLYQGLSGVEKLPGNGGLLMDFKVSDTHGIVMRDMYVPLDIVWLDEAKQVVYIVKNASPELNEQTVFQPKKPARYVLELRAGSVERSAIKVGDIATFDITGGAL